MMNTDSKRDEREHKLLTESLAAAGAIAYFYGIFVLIFKLIKTKDFSSVYVEFGLIMIMAITMFIHRTLTRNYDIPKTLSGKVLATGSTKEDKRARISYYTIDALKFSIFWTFFNYIRKGPKGLLFKSLNSYVGIFIDGALTFVVFLTLNYLWYENNVKRYNAYCQSLEDELDAEDDSYDDCWESTDPFNESKDILDKTECPNCGEVHDIDYPKCPKCKYNYYPKKGDINK